MFHRGPVVITSLEEDFKKIGLIAETKSEQTENLGEDAEGEDEGEPVGEGRIMKALARFGRKVTRLHRTPSTKRQKSKRYRRAHKAQIRLHKKKKLRTAKGRKRANFVKKMYKKRHHESADGGKIASLLEEVQDIVTSIEAAPKEQAHAEHVKSFANIAIISDMLANVFGDWSKNLDEEYSDQDTYDSLAEAAETLADLAEAAAEVATGLKEGNEIEVEELETLFKEYMADLLEGMDLYNEVVSQMDTMHGKAGNVGQSNGVKKKGKTVSSDPLDAKGEAVVEDEDEDDEDDDEDDDEEESESKGKKKKHESASKKEDDDEDDDEKDEDDDEDDDEKDEGKMPAFLKKKFKMKGEADEKDDDDDDDDEDDSDDDNDDADSDEESKKRPHKR